MVILIFILKSLVMGFAMAMPVGPVGVLCIRRTLKFGWLSGFVTGSAVALADSLYGAIASTGLSTISQKLLEHQTPIRAVGGVVMIIMGVQIYFSKTKFDDSKELTSETLIKDFVTAFAITITNPITILSFGAVYVALGIGQQIEHNIGMTSALVAGVFVGSCGWWVLLSFLTLKFKTLLSTKGLAILNHAAGAMIFIFGVVAIGSAVWNHLH